MAISKIVQNSLSDTISLGPKITSVQVANSTYVVKDDTNINIGGGYIVITGSGFQSNCSVIVDSNLACSVAFVSATQVRAELPAKPAGTYNIYLLNGDGGTAIRVNALQYSNTPTWVTTSPLTSQNEDSNVSIQLAANGANTYALQSGSTLPNGLTLSANGLISGTVNTNVSVDTTYNFTVEAIDTELQETPKAFAVTISVSDTQIPRSLRFNSADSAYLSRTPGSATNRKTWTWSGWVKRSKFVQYGGLFTAWSSNDDSGYAVIRFDDNQLLFKNWNTVYRQTSQVFRDPAAWYHIVVALDTTQATAANRLKMYVNGSQITSFTTSNDPTQNADFNINNNVLHTLGVNYFSSSPTYFFDGYLTEVHFVDGQALTPDTFGKWSNLSGGSWVAKTVSGVTYGTNGFYLPFTDNSNTTSTTLGKDSAGSNNWTPTNFSVSAGSGNDSLLDSPSPYGTDDGSGADVRGSYCTLNPLDKGSNLTFSNGNLFVSGSGNPNNNCRGTVGVKSGKWYWECSVDSGVPGSVFGIASDSCSMTTNFAGDMYAYDSNGQKVVNGTSSGYGASYIAGDLIGIAFDADNLSITFYKNNVSQGTITGITSGLTWRPFVHANGVTVTSNFGQRPFAYTAPSGFNCLVSQNITPGINANTSSTLANSYFKVITWTGNGATQNVTGLDFQPDMVWLKGAITSNHRIYDSIRGATKSIYPDISDAEGTESNGLTAFLSNGFSLGDQAGHNQNAANYAAFCWNAGGANTTNTSGSITSTIRVNQTAGFSIVTYTTQGSGTATVGHGLGKAPKFMLVKPRTAFQWDVYHDGIGKDAYLVLDTDSAQQTGATTVWNSTAPTSTVFSLGSAWASAAPNAATVAYCWAEIEGFSRFGSFTGNGSSDGPFVYCGFRPALIIYKKVNASSNWWMLDNARNTYNVAGTYFFPDTNAAGGVEGEWIDFLSNGFKLIGRTDVNTNGDGGSYIFCAWAENPFKYARAR